MKNKTRYETPAIEYILRKGLATEYFKWYNSEGDKEIKQSEQEK